MADIEQMLFTPASVIDLLSKIDELADYNISLTETFDNKLQLQVGDSIYEIDTDNSTSLRVDSSTLAKAIDVNEDAYAELDDNFDVQQDVNAGIIKEVAKTLLLGGMLRLSAKMLNK